MQPKVYFAEQHDIRDSSIDRDALFVLSRLREEGFIAYLVGGGVRDLLMGKEPKDFDISTSARPEQIKRLFRNCILIGRRFRLAHVRFGRHIIEVSTFRAGETEEANLILRDNVWGSPEQDVLRRDFTINGLFYDPSDHKIIDYVGGFKDLTLHLLRTIGTPTARFRQDPVRMIRCLKFRARFGFQIDQEILAALSECRDEILKSSPARLLEEMLRMLESGASEPFFHLLQEFGFLDLLFPALAKAMRREVGSTIYAYLRAADNYLLASRAGPLLDRSVLLSSLLFPLVQDKLEERMAESGKEPSSAAYQELAWQVLEATLSNSFLEFPRRLRALTGFILESQLRLTAQSGPTVRRARVASHPDFPLALQFLSLRSLVDPSVTEVYNTYKEPPRRAPRRRTPKEE